METDSGFVQFALDEGVAVQPIGGLEGKEGGHAHDDRPQCLVADVEVEMRETAALGSQDPVVGVLRGELRNRDAKGAALFHALEDEVDAVGVLLFHPLQGRQDVIFFAQSFFRPLDGEVMVAGVRLDPLAVFIGTPRECFFADHRNPEDLMEEVNHLFGAGHATEVPMDDDAVEAVVYKNQQAGKQLCEQFHRSSASDLVSSTRSSVRRPVESKFQISLARSKHGDESWLSAL